MGAAEMYGYIKIRMFKNNHNKNQSPSHSHIQPYPLDQAEPLDIVPLKKLFFVLDGDVGDIGSVAIIDPFRPDIGGTVPEVR